MNTTNILCIKLILYAFVSNSFDFFFFSDIVDERSHDTSGGPIYPRAQGYLEDPLSILQNHVSAQLGGKQPEVTFSKGSVLFMLKISEVFFISSMSSSLNSVIEHDQFSYIVYKAFLKYLYTDVIDLPVEKALGESNIP